ncbi:hypothetical protein BDV25DRAFT_150805 [Aspergillus avenaceus]|uniref:Zn(2)-C6 fungal-type domain-containing protein n=1 Tax=Aspergillus avenaceus TaxID=36643 RepID=A0A5N6U2A6_ASPAV|nr:hypothetical protein BDV25DRAFT_150805 [Aspergillus avenaceus]
MYRRNGKPVSCEPCRLAKVRCDHATPICGRCRTRRIQECFYHPAPMTRSSTRYRHYQIKCTSNLHPCDKLLASNIKTHHCSRKHTEQHERYDHGQSSEGVPSSSANFTSLTLPPTMSTTASRPLEANTSRFDTMKPYVTRLCTSIAQYVKLIMTHYDRSQFHVIPRPLIVDPMLTLQKDLEAGLDVNSHLVRNACQPLPELVPDMSLVQFSELLTGPNVRWEFLGVIFALAGHAAFHTDVEKWWAGNAFTTEMFQASKLCLEICEESNQLNDLTIWLRYANVALTSHVFGDTSHDLYRMFNSLIAEIFAIGFHRQNFSNPKVPFYISETRKRIFASTFSRDKNLAALLERPPLMDSKFCNMVFPFDLSDEEIVLNGSELDAALQGLDQDGWKTPSEGETLIRPATGIRLRYLFSDIRVKVLRLSLGNRNGDVGDKCRELYREYEAIRERVPPQYRYESDCWKYLNAGTCIAMLIIHLDYLYCGFQIQRILRQEGQNILAALLDTSMKLLSAMLDYIRQQWRIRELKQRYAWIFFFYGLPGAGTLAAEIRQSTLEGTQLPLSVPYSRIIRDLSVAVSWFENYNYPRRPDYQLCLQISKVISKLLDETLDHSLIPSSDATTHSDKNNTVLNDSISELPVDLLGENEIQPSIEPTTSEEFLSWFDDLLWDGSISMEV